MSPANATEIEIAGGEEGDKFEVGKIYDVKLTTGIEFKGIVLAYDPDPHLVIFQERTIPETGDSMNTRMVNENFISTLTYIGKCKDPLASKERWIDLSGLEEKEAIAIREIESIGVGVTAEAQKVFNDLSKTKIESIGVGVAAEAPKSFDAFSKTYPIEQDLVVEILPVPVMRARDIIVAANMALKKKIFAQKISRATNGAYFLMDEKMRKVAVFKPEEEEDGCSRKGEKANREVAAYLLDFPKDSEEDGFGGVPPTTMVRCMDFKGDREKRWAKGSLQQFIPNKKWYVHGERSDAIFSIQDFQKMTLLDIRYGNTERNQDNILNKEGKLIPIDHGECFPTEFDRYRLDWTVWEMAEIPYLTEMVEYVKTLDVDKDLEILRTNGIELGGRAVFVFRVQHMVLKLGVLGGNVPKDIGHLLTHPLSGGTSESLGTLFHKCMTRNPTDVTLLMDSLHDSIKGVLQWAREERVLRREIKSIGVGVTAEAQKIFDAFSKT